MTNRNPEPVPAAAPQQGRSSDTFEEIILYAMEQEEEEERFYLELAQRSDSQELREMMQAHAREEAAHREELEKILHAHRLPRLGRQHPDPDLHIADYLVAPERIPGKVDYLDALVLAIKQEQANCNLYQDLARLSVDPAARRVFRFLAEQERRHKEQLEREYDDSTRGAD